MTSSAPGASRDAVSIVPAAPLGSDGRLRDGRFRASYRRQRARLDGFPRLRWLYKLGVALVGFVVVVLGLVLVPLPGPGWLIVFVGVAILGTEFPLAHRVMLALRRVAHRLRLRWRAWRVARAASAAKPTTR
jgi:uncharacterized protein (TIGR02611 family)